MTNRAISHVVEAEETIAKIRQNADEKRAVIEVTRDSKISQIKKDLDEAIKIFRKEQKQNFEEVLANKIENHKEEVKLEAKKYDYSYSQKQEAVSDYIVKEVLKRYGDE